MIPNEIKKLIFSIAALVLYIVYLIFEVNKKLIQTVFDLAEFTVEFLINKLLL